MSDVILMDIKIPAAGVEKAIAEVAKLKGEIQKLKEANKELGNTDPKYIENEARAKALAQQLRENERVVVANIKAQESNKGSIEQLRAQLSRVTVEWSKLSKEERENSKEGKDLTQSKKELTNQLKQLEGATGDNRRNVGNYSEGMREALLSTGALGKGTTALFNTMKANPLILLATLLAGLIQKVAATQGAMDALDKVMQPLNTMFERFVGIVQEAFKNVLPALAKAIANPQQAIKDLGQAIATNLINRFTALGKIIKNIVNGEWAELGDSVLQLGTGIEGLGSKVKGFTDQMAEAAKEGARIAELNIKIADAQNALEISEAKLNRTIEEQKLILADVSKTAAERQAAAMAATKAVNELESQRLAILDLEIEKKAIQIKQNDTDRVAQGEYNKLLAEREEIARQSVTRQKEITSQLNSVNKQASDALKKMYADEAREKAAAEKEKIAAEKAAAAERVEIARQEMQDKVNAAKLAASEELNAVKQLYVEGTFSREQYNKYLNELQLKALETERALLEAAGQQVVDIDSKILDFKIANLAKEVEVQAVTEDQKVSLVSSGAKTAGDIFGQQSVAFKLLSSAEAAMNTYTAATAALKIPIVGQLQAALITIQGLAQVAKINATPLPKFATGIIGLDGAGTSTSDSVPAMISRNESVMTARATAAFAPQLAAMEVAVGNTPRLGSAGRQFVRGLQGFDSNAARISGRTAANESQSLVDVLSRANIMVSVIEIEDKMQEVNAAKAYASVGE
jgi:CRP-like cAMP-binding protein